ncbi:exopolyphosphatase/guanosine-5'-triphosphate,3'-diphosphate pyrophosphatase [Ochrobactrum intermedium]|uniref:Exopolyphosphatase/guanosine-5'-triphosphate, 3'-diphosphate pyrophosphatase n=1 Tax=Brucella intermedia TaxID=94625 RepID=A0ABR6ANK7_9HYPH|nr:Ppx/GppA phosphatase family protein [Brucella intermedia]KAB2709850.1 Ppx/GppA family phosphatase [Brucella intermedia]MBA8851038.1 exopolyphosphatase/guanosine-5'-triphosphate,3'-diphosphate pyrophosphatase [Brucella intermedia]UXO85800.1 Ppx/GppA family phosphatase [Brucella intermedia]WGJ09471.1 Ppx/GppA phosphatase family protein [Brucella intermedia]
MKNPDERTAETVHQGASGGQSGNSQARNPSDNGKRRPRKKAVADIGNARSASDSGRSKAQDETEGTSSQAQRKRARRRRRGKSVPALETSSQKPAATDPGNNQQRPSGKISNRRRRARKKKQSRQLGAQTPPAAEVAVKTSHNAVRAENLHVPVQNKRKSTNGQTPRASNGVQHDKGDAPLYAALDLGTNNCRLLVASPTRPGQFRVVDAFSRIVRLGEGLSATGRLSDNAMDRAVEALKICRDKLAGKKIRRSRLIATEACRSASNGEQFLERVRAETGLELEIVDRQTEARLAVSGCGTLVTRETDAVVLFDIGGGSSEIALIDVSRRRSPRLAEHIMAWTSLPVGVVTLAERFGGRNVTQESFDSMVSHVTDLLTQFAERQCLGNLTASPRFHLLGTSGTVTTLAGIHLGLERYDRRRVDGMWMGAEDVTQMTNRLLSWDFDARVANPCIGADRADLVLAGCAILDAIRKVWPSEKLLVADRGLREGILTELMSRDGAWRHNRATGARNRH